MSVRQIGQPASIATILSYARIKALIPYLAQLVDGVRHQLVSFTLLQQDSGHPSIWSVIFISCRTISGLSFSGLLFSGSAFSCLAT